MVNNLFDQSLIICLRVQIKYTTGDLLCVKPVLDTVSQALKYLTFSKSKVGECNVLYNESNCRRITKRMVIKKALENPT